MRTIDQMVQQEVLCCMSHIVSVLANGMDNIDRRANGPLADMCEQAFELCCPIPDYEEAAIQAGWTRGPGGYSDVHASDPKQFDSWEDLCAENDIDPYDREVFEHWAVTDWFADKLLEQGEKVDKDFGNLCIWARTTTGQGIASDGVVERIHANAMKA